MDSCQICCQEVDVDSGANCPQCIWRSCLECVKILLFKNGNGDHFHCPLCRRDILPILRAKDAIPLPPPPPKRSEEYLFIHNIDKEEIPQIRILTHLLNLAPTPISLNAVSGTKLYTYPPSPTPIGLNAVVGANAGIGRIPSLVTPSQPMETDKGNVFIGYGSGRDHQKGSFNTLLGIGTGLTATNYQGCLCLGAGAKAQEDNTLSLGSAEVPLKIETENDQRYLVLYVNGEKARLLLN